MPFCLLSLFLVVLIISGWGLLCWRYKSKLAIITVITVAILASVLTISNASIFIPEINNEDLPKEVSNEDLGIDVFHEDWQLIKSISKTPVELEYRLTEGVIVRTEDEEVRIGGVTPGCTREIFDVASDLVARVVTDERCQICNDLALPPSHPKDQLTLEIVYPKVTERFGAVSYAVYDNGEVWCSERHVHLGMPNLAFAVVPAFDYIALVLFTVGVFVISFVGGIIVTIIIFEVQRRKGKNCPDPCEG